MDSKQWVCACAAGLACLLLAHVRPARALDLDTALRRVADANPTLASQRAMTEAARRRIAPAGAWPSPMIELGAVNVPTTGGFDSEPMTMKMIGVSQRVPVFGSNRLAGASARSAAEAEGAASEMAHYDLFAATWETYAEAYYADRLARLARSHQDDMGRLVRAAEARYETGGGRLDDVLRAQAEQARTLADLASFEAEGRAARARLDELMGQSPDATADTLAPPPAVAVPADASPWVSAVSASHPRLRELAAQVERDRLAARADRRSVWPDLELGASYGIREPIAGVAQTNMWSFRLGFELPLFAGPRQLSQAAAMDAMARARAANLRAATLDLEQQVVATHATALADQRTVTLLADTVVTTERRAVEASWSAYKAGVTDLWRVLEATHELYNEEVALLRSRLQLSRTEASLLSITARGDVLGVQLPAIRRDEQ